MKGWTSSSCISVYYFICQRVISVYTKLFNLFSYKNKSIYRQIRDKLANKFKVNITDDGDLPQQQFNNFPIFDVLEDLINLEILRKSIILQEFKWTLAVKATRIVSIFFLNCLFSLKIRYFTSMQGTLNYGIICASLKPTPNRKLVKNLKIKYQKSLRTVR
jgi:hypothetical protein